MHRPCDTLGMRHGNGLSFRRSCRLLVVLAAVWGLGTTVAPADESGRLQAGAYVADITPPRFPISMNGGMSDRQATAAHDPLSARCFVLSDGTCTLAIAVCDSCVIPRDVFDLAKREASKATGIPESRMLISATHTHSAPSATSAFQSDPDDEYRQFLVEKIAAGIAEAHRRLRPAKVGWGTASDPSQVFNRRWFMQSEIENPDPFGRTNDKVRMNPGYQNLDRPSGPVDPEIGILSIQTVDGRPLALLANYSLHYVGGTPAGAVSADYFGEFSRRIAPLIGVPSADDTFVAAMSNGTSGNINNVNYGGGPRTRQEPFEQIRVVAASVADAVARAYPKIEHRTDVTLAMAEREIELAVRLPSSEDVQAAQKLLEEAGPGPYRDRTQIYARETLLLRDYPPQVWAKLQAIRIGELGIVSSPCETFVETGLAIKEKSPLPVNFTIELANGYNGYLPTKEHHDFGGYETWRARSSYLHAGSEATIRETLLQLLEEVAASAPAKSATPD